MNKNILMIAYTNYATDSRVMREAEALVEDGLNVDFLCLKDNNKNREILNGVNIIKIRQRRSRSNRKIFYILSYIIFCLRALFLTAWLFIKKKYYLVHVNNLPDFLVFAAFVPKIFGAKIILDIHDPLPETFLTKFKGNRKNFVYVLLLWIEKLSACFADAVITVSNPIKDDILMGHGLSGKKIYVVSNFADSKLFNFNKDYKIDDKIKLIFHGTIAERFGIDNVLYALARIRKNSSFEFKIIGKGVYSSRLKEIINELNLNDIVKFDNFTYEVNDLPKLLRSYHIGVISYNFSHATNYMLPVKLLEYFSMGIPSIAPKTKVISHYFGDNLVLYYEPNKPEYISEILESISTNPEILYDLRQKIFLNKDLYMWDKEKIKYKKIINSYIGNTNG